MKRYATVRVLIALMAIMTLSGCGKTESIEQTEEETLPEVSADLSESVPEAAVEAAEEPENMDPGLIVPEEDIEEETVPEESVDYQVSDISDLIVSEADTDTSAEDGEVLLNDMDTAPSDTVEYVKSDREEQQEIRRVESRIDEDDPDTYTIVRTEEEVETTEEIPTEYTDGIGNVKYKLLDEGWVEYRYSRGNMEMAGDPDTETALMLLNLFGDYDDYELVSLEYSEKPDEEGTYVYEALYRATIPLTELPEDLEDLTVTDTEEQVVLRTEEYEEKVPVMLTEKVGTGEYRYYGWQELEEGEVLYFDKDGDKVRGMQVIQGLRYYFDKHGVLENGSGVTVSSRNGVIDWKAVRASGIETAMIRCGYRGSQSGRLICDSRCAENVEGAIDAGLDVVLWFYSQAVTEQEAVEEASFLASAASKHGITSPLVLRSGYSKEFQGRADSLSKEDRTTCISAGVLTLQNAGYTPMLCAEAEWLDTNLTLSDLGGVLLWLVQYNSEVTYPGAYSVWQYTEKGLVEGIEGYTGLNIKSEN